MKLQYIFEYFFSNDFDVFLEFLVDIILLVAVSMQPARLDSNFDLAQKVGDRDYRFQQHSIH